MNNNSLKYERSTHESKRNRRNPIKEKVQPPSQPEEKRIKLSMSSRKSPLDSKLLQEPYPLKFKVPKFETYGGTSDPQEHIDKFISLMEIQTARDDLLCRVFPLTLKGISYQWFANLPSASITDFSDLGRKFLAQHTALLRVKNEPYILGNIEHGNLSLRDYTKKFTEALTIVVCDRPLYEESQR
ncbi:hypothetical protein ZOSMA_351G00090 [Zostera marina]|uniref:Retrotransposon gag domain-containing protein n=1 Tax=Zostera marina TaxID=29655 RepID=A0A0K9P6T4_ZOSMR|nr:hypothetical protein ZOSMA_351G00090 [Zostera marina]